LFEIKILGIRDVKSNVLFVSHDGNDLIDCGNKTMPCRSIRHAVKISNDSDQIYVEYAKGRPYMECENMTKSACPIELTKSVSFYGISGKAEIRCKKDCKLFRITSPGYNISRIQFVNLIISTSGVAVVLIPPRSKLVFRNALVKNNIIGISGKYLSDCSIEISNSSFEHNYHKAILLQCSNLTAHVSSSTFKLSPVSFQNFRYKPWNIKVLVSNTVFDGENTQMCADMFTIRPCAAVVNITIIDSKLRNHYSFSCPDDLFVTLKIQDSQSKAIHRILTFIFLKDLVVENNFNRNPTIRILSQFFPFLRIRDSIFRNNSEALWVSIKSQSMVLENNTFVDNFASLLRLKSAAAVYFDLCEVYFDFCQVSLCRFLDNKAGPNPNIGVVTISPSASVTFTDCYFENQQTSAQSNQVFAFGNEPLYFRGDNTFNLLALKKEQTVFMRIPNGQPLPLGMFINKNFKILCPQGYTLTLQGKYDTNMDQFYYINVQCDRCHKKTYMLERGQLTFNQSNGVQCQQCPRGGNCDSGLITAKPNFWGYKNKMNISFIQCPPGYCCESEDCLTFDSCHGNRSGTLCGQCPEGMSESLFSTQCISNTECSINYIIILGTIAILALYLVFFLYQKEIMNFLRRSLLSKRLSFSRNRQNEQRNNFNTGGNTYSASGIVKIIFYYYQVCNLLRSSVGSRKNSEFIHNFENVISGIMNMILVNVPSFICPLKDLRAVPKAAVLHSVGYCLLVLLCLLHLVGMLILFLGRIKRGGERRLVLQYLESLEQVNSARKSSFSQRVASAFTYISLLMYASSAKLCLSLLHCVPVGDSQVLFLDGNIKCYQTFQYFVFAYMISSILPFCLVPVLGSYLLKVGRIGVKQFCAACIFPLPFCCFWMYLLLKDCRRVNQGTYNMIEQNNEALSQEQSNEQEQITSATDDSRTTSNRGSEASILSVLLGPFRCHQAFMCFPSSHIPWEGFLIFRRLVLIIVLNFVHDIQLRLFVALMVCVAILGFHVSVNPFQRKSDNVLEFLSLSAHVVLCGLTLIKALYYGEDYSAFSNTLSVLNVIENILIVAPLSIIMTVLILCLVVKLAFGLTHSVSVLIRKVRNLIRFTE
jgi:hypothetical protein